MKGRQARGRRGPVCLGSGRAGLDGRFPGDRDRCSSCSRNHVPVLASNVLAAHAPGKDPR